MATIMIGSARIDENGKATGGAAGDQKQTSSTNDTAGEVSMQSMYTHSKGWYILRPTSVSVANKLAELMKTACNNANIGYDQNNRLGIITYGINTTTKTECDCSSLVRECVKEATGTDPGNFTTANEATKLAATGLFESKIAYVSQSKTPVYNGDVLVTKTKGHTVIVVSGNARSSDSTSSSSASSSSSSSSSTASSSSKTATDKAAKYDKTLAGTYKVTGCTTLNTRNGAGTDKSVMVAIPQGTVVTNYGYYSLSGSTKWLYVLFTYKSVTYTGFASEKYLTKQ